MYDIKLCALLYAKQKVTKVAPFFKWDENRQCFHMMTSVLDLSSNLIWSYDVMWYIIVFSLIDLDFYLGIWERKRVTIFFSNKKKLLKISLPTKIWFQSLSQGSPALFLINYIC